MYLVKALKNTGYQLRFAKTATNPNRKPLILKQSSFNSGIKIFLLIVEEPLLAITIVKAKNKIRHLMKAFD